MANKILDAAISERDWQNQVRELALLHGWLIYHTHDSRRSDPGFPDLVLVRERVVYAELKREKGKLTAEQKAWRYSLNGAGAETYVWRPSDWNIVMATLKRQEVR